VVTVRNVLVLHLAERPKQFPRSGAVAALAIYASHDLLLHLNMTATDSDVSLGFIKGRRLHCGVHLFLCSGPTDRPTHSSNRANAERAVVA
jgi:hypothetical protein